MTETESEVKSNASGQARTLIPVSEQEKMSLEDLAKAILDRRLRPGVAQLRQLAEAVLTASSSAESDAEGKAVKEGKKRSGKTKKDKKSGKKKAKGSNRGKLPKIPKAKA